MADIGAPRLQLAALLAIAAVGAVLPDEPEWAPVLLIVPLWAVASLVRAARRRAGDDPTAWWLLAAGVGLIAGAELSWWVGDMVGREAYPTEADFLNGFGVLVLIAGLSVTASRLSSVPDRAGFIDAAAVGVAAASLAWLFVFEPAATSTNTSEAEQAGLILVIMLDVALLAVGAQMMFTLRSRSPVHRVIYVAIAVTVTVDVLDALLEIGAGVDLGQRMDAVGLIGIGLWAIAASPGLVGPRHESDAAHRFGRVRLLILALCAFVPLVAFTAHLAQGGTTGSTAGLVVVVATVAAGALVVARIGGLLRLVAEMTSAQGRAHFAALVEHSADAILALNRDLEIEYASPSTDAVLGCGPASLMERPLTEVVTSDDDALVTTHLARVISSDSATPVRFQTSIDSSDGRARDYEATAAKLDQFGEDGVVVTMRDITTQLDLERQLRIRAFLDELTGLANRALFYDRLTHALDRRGAEPGANVAILYLDLDQFKQVNDGLGHQAGDELLAAVADRLRSCARAGDTVARLGGDEFALLLEHPTSEAAAVAAAGRILEVLQLPMTAGGLDLSVRASIGIVLADGNCGPDELVRDADIAMYEAKASAATKVSVFVPPMRAAATRRIELVSELERALETDQLTLRYQPIVDLAGRRIVACEALLRWRHADRGPVAPDEFIPVAEQTGMIGAIGRHVLREACRDAARWQTPAQRVEVAVNVSAVQFQDPGLREDVVDALDVSGLSPDLLTLELTETALMTDPAATMEALARLRSLGVALAVDDFGTGHCSLAYVRRFAPDKLKIDRTFVAEITAATPTDLLAHNMVRLAESIGIPAIGEGIETPAQAESLLEAGCALGQGFFFSRPIEPEAFSALLRADQALPGLLTRSGAARPSAGG